MTTPHLEHLESINPRRLLASCMIDLKRKCARANSLANQIEDGLGFVLDRRVSIVGKRAILDKLMKNMVQLEVLLREIESSLNLMLFQRNN